MQGNGFITDSNIISKYRLSDANPFFSTLWDKPYVGKVRMLPAAVQSARANLLSTQEWSPNCRMSKPAACWHCMQTARLTEP